ncbi:MAG: peptidylprolyl isomerase [Ruminococcaceae bacterium]|nr:peptidylprolyl isomerase [Oscillospiraceae bacterium]
MKQAACIAAACLLLGACGAPAASGGDSLSEAAPTPGGSTQRAAVASEEIQFRLPAEGDTVARIETSMGIIDVVLYPQLAPLAVENFTTLAGRGYYADTTFHRVVRGFVVQGGDATGTGLGGESIWGSPFATERSDKLHHYAGALCMAAADGEADTHLSQFFIVASAQDSLDETALAQLSAAGLREAVVDAYRQAGGAPYLDNTDTVFGQVYAGMDVVDAIANVSVDDDGRPKNAVQVVGITAGSYPLAAGGDASSGVEDTGA